jgi:hypothetical protein
MAHVEPGDAREEMAERERKAAEYYAGKHTPGPWLVEDEGDGDFMVAADVPKSRGLWKLVALVQRSKPDRARGSADVSGEEVKANARLIGAAPDLLLMLKRLLAAARCNYCAALVLSEYGAEAEAAIAKADGTA